MDNLKEEFKSLTGEINDDLVSSFLLSSKQFYPKQIVVS